MKLFLFPVSLALCVLAWAGGVRAEPVLAPRDAIKLAPELALPAALNDLRSPEYLALRRDVRRARGMLMVGSSLMTAAVVHMSVLGRQTYCYGYEQPVVHLKTPPIAAGVAAGIGLGLLIGGGLKLAHMPEGFRRVRPASEGPVTLLVLGAIAATVTSSLLLYAVSAPEILRCD